MIVKLLTERHLEFLSITGGCRGPSESTLVKMSNCWKSRALAQIIINNDRTSTNLLKNAAKMMQGENTHLLAKMYKPYFTYFSFTQFQ